MTLKFEVSEIFSSLQGEGPFIGRPAMFLRLRRCNLSCDFCDTRYTWDPEDSGYNDFRLMSPEEVWDEIHSCSLLIVTGGEPLIWRGLLGDLIEQLPFDMTVQFETAGTISPLDYKHPKVMYVVSPKLSSSGNLGRNTIRSRVLKEFAKRARVKKAFFKFVVCHKQDLVDIDFLVKEFDIPPLSVYLMSEGVDRKTIEEKLPMLFEHCVSRNYNLTTRLHILTYGQDQKGL